MSESVSGTVAGPGDARDEQAAEESGRILDVLGDEDARRILGATGAPKTVSELVDELGITQSTAYRKIRLLERSRLLERANPDATGNTPTRYRRTVRELTVRLQQDVHVEYSVE